MLQHTGIVSAPQRVISEMSDPRLILALVGSAIAMITPLLLHLYWPAGHGIDVIGMPLGRDFLNAWAGPQLAARGDISIIYDLNAYNEAAAALFGRPLPDLFNFSYPPFVLLLFRPLGLLPHRVALAVWTVATFATLAAVMLSQIERRLWAFALALLAIAPASLINGVSGQNGFLSGALLLGGIIVLDRRPIAAGILFGLLTFKPHLGLVLVFVLLTLRAWRAVASAVITAGLLVGLSLLLFGGDPWLQYLDGTRTYQLQLLKAWHGIYVHMMPTWLGALRTAGVAYQAAIVLQGVVALAVVGACCWAVGRTRDPAWRAFIVALATPLALPYAFNYDLVAATVGLVWILTGRLAVPLSWRGPVLLAWVIPLLPMYTYVSFNLTLAGVAPAALTALFLLALQAHVAVSGNAPVPAQARA